IGDQSISAPACQGFAQRDQSRGPIGPSKDRLGNGSAFLVVGVEQRLWGRSCMNQGKLPGKVVHILNTSVHSLTTGGAVNVRRVSRQKTTTFSEAIDHLSMDAKR